MDIPFPSPGKPKQSPKQEYVSELQRAKTENREKEFATRRAQKRRETMTRRRGVTVSAPAVAPSNEPINPFWTAIASEVEGVNPNEVAAVLKKLAFFDSIHDFWPERATVKGVTDNDEDEPVDIDDSRLNAVHTALIDTIGAYLNKQGINDIGLLLQAETGETVTSTSGVEDKVLAYFKKTYAPFNEPEGYITLNEILAEWKFTDKNSNWETYSTAVGSLSNAIDIVFSGRSVKSLTDAERGHVAFFLLSYMNPSVQPAPDAVEYFTFDMAPRDIGKIFARIDQVKNAIFPQNIADSASTSFSSLLGRNQFFMGGDTQTAAPPSYPIRSNAFTGGKYRLQYVNEGFGPTNKFGFKIEVWDAAGNTKLGEIPFGVKNEQGPSVNYLMDIIAKLNNPDEAATALSTTEPKLATVAKLTNLGVPDADLLFDIKRTGDWEQMLINNVTAVTGDRFAAAFRRLLRKTGMYHSSRGIKVWRGTMGISAEELEARSRNFRIQQVLSKLAIISDFMANTNGVREALQAMKDQVDAGAANGFVFNAPIQLPVPLTREYIATNYTAIASTFATLVLRARMQDLSAHIGSLITNLQMLSYLEPEIRNATCAVNYPNNCPTPVPEPPNISTIDAALDTLETVIKGTNELEAMNISFSATTGDVEPIYVKLFEDNGKLIKGATTLKFNFSAGPFVHAETGLTAVVARVLLLSKARRPDAVAPQINKLLVDYFGARDMIKEAFFDSSMKAEIEALTDIPSGATPAQVISEGPDGLLGVIQRVVEKFPVSATNPTVGGAETQSGGVSGSPLQFRDLHDLFLQLCLDISSETLDDIESRWVTGVDELRTNAIEDYGAAFEETGTTDLISFILSFRTGLSSLFPEEMTRRNAVRFNDIGGILLQKTPVEPFIMEVLVKTAYIIKKKEADRYASREGWDRLSNVIATVMQGGPTNQEAFNLLGGGLETANNMHSNANRSSSSVLLRRGLYERLR